MGKHNKSNKKAKVQDKKEKEKENLLLEQVKENKVSGYQAVPNAGKSTTDMSNLVNAGLKIFVVEHTIDAVTSLANYQKKIMTNHSVGYAANSIIKYYNQKINQVRNIERNTETNRDTDLVYVTPRHMVNIISDFILLLQNENVDIYFCDLIVIDEANSLTLDCEEIYRMWNYLNVKGIKLPNLLLMSAFIPSEISIFKDFPVIRKNVESPFKITYRYLEEDVNILSKEALIILSNILKKDIQKNCELGTSSLVFLAGIDEINHFQDCILEWSEKNFKNTIEILQVHSYMSKAERDRINLPIPENVKRIILSTNILETAVTILKLSAVYDSLVEKIPQKRDIEDIKLVNSVISKSSGLQRAFRTGRVCDGIVFRMCTENFYNSLDTSKVGEIKRLPLFKNILSALHIKIDPVELYSDSLDYDMYTEIITQLCNLEMIDIDTELNNKKEEYDLDCEVSFEDKITLSRCVSDDFTDTNSTLKVTDIGKFAIDMHLPINLSYILYKFIKNGIYSVFDGIVLVCIIKNLGGGSYLYYPDKRKEQSISEYNSFKETWSRDHFSIYDSDNDLQFLFKLFRELIYNLNIPTNSGREYHFNYSRIIKYTHKNSLNSKKIIECLRLVSQICEHLDIPICQMSVGSKNIINYIISLLKEVHVNSVCEKKGYKYINTKTNVEFIHFPQLCHKETSDKVIPIITLETTKNSKTQNCISFSVPYD